MNELQANVESLVWQFTTTGMTDGLMSATNVDRISTMCISGSFHELIIDDKQLRAQHSLPSVGPGADPDVQAVRPQVTTISHLRR